MKRLFAISLCVCSALLYGGCSSSQYIGSGRDMVPSSSLPRLLGGSSVTVALASGELLYGKVLSSGEDSLDILSDGETTLRHMPRDSVKTVSTVPSILPIVGGALLGGAVVGLIAYESAKPQGGPNNWVALDFSGPAAAAGGVIGALVGGTIGAVSSPTKVYLFPVRMAADSASKGAPDEETVALELDRLVEEGHTYFVGIFKGQQYRFAKANAALYVEKHSAFDVYIVRATRRYFAQLGVAVH